MKILHISTYDFGGAGLAALRLHKSLLSQGIDSNMLVMQKTTDLDSVYVATPCGRYDFIPSKNRLFRHFQTIMRGHGKMLTRLEYYKRQYYSKLSSQKIFFTFPITQYDLAENPLVKEADIIHLHWIADFLDYESFFGKVNKPIIWTFHDYNPFMGGFHYFSTRTKFYFSLKNIEDDFINIKSSSIKSISNLTLVAISDEMKSKMHSSTLFASNNIYEIYNSIDPEIFGIIDKSIVRKIFHITQNVVFLFVSLFLEDPIKGLEKAIASLEKLNIPDSILLCVGQGKPPVSNIVTIRKFDSVPPELLQLFYSSADYLLFPSSEESFGQTPVEANSCGTPVVAFPVGVVPELINDTNGVICKDFTVEALSYGIKTAMSRQYNAQIIRQSVIEKFSPKKIVSQFIDLYYQVLK